MTQDVQASLQTVQEIYTLIQNSVTALNDCGTPVLHLLGRFFRDDTSYKTRLAIATSLNRLANEKLNSYPYKEVPECWRQLYSDAINLKATIVLIRLLGGIGNTGKVGVRSAKEEESTLLGLIKDLDLAIIIAGSPGEGRKDSIFQLISICQSLLSSPSFSSPSPTASEPPKKRRRTNATRLSLPYLTSPIPTLTSPPSHSEFLSLAPSTPFILKSGCSDWPASEEGRWRDTKLYLEKVAGRGRVVPVEVGKDYTEEGWGQRIIELEKFLRNFEGEEGEETLYLAQHDLFTQFSELYADIVVPDYVYSSPTPFKALSSSGEAPSTNSNTGEKNYEYSGPQTDVCYITNCWLGPQGTFSPAHTDPWFNCYAQVVGSKWIWVAPPSITSHMSTFASPSPPRSPSPSLVVPTLKESSSHSHHLTNTSRHSILNPDSLPNEVKEKALQGVLEEGDMLFLPPAWWHGLLALEKSWGVSIWY